MSAQQPIIRRAEERDRVGLQAVAAWNGADYLPRFITAWLNDAEGEFFVAELGAQIVGAGKLTRFAAEEWWLEGLRVHPDFQRRGIGKLLHSYGVRRAQVLGGGLLRLSTDEDNGAVHRMAVASGFEAMGKYLRYETSAYAHQLGAAQFQSLGVDDVIGVQAFLLRSRHFDHVQGSTFERYWKAHKITDDSLRGWAAEGRIYGWQRGAAVGYVIAGAPSPLAPELFEAMYIDAAEGKLAQLFRALRGLAGKLGYTGLRYMLPVHPDHLVAIEQAGWRRPKDNSGRAVLYAKQLDKS